MIYDAVCWFTYKKVVDFPQQTVKQPEGAGWTRAQGPAADKGAARRYIQYSFLWVKPS